VQLTWLEHKFRMALDTASGMHYLHQQDIIHRDVKPQNLLVSETLGIRIADMGAAIADHGGTVRAAAPRSVELASHFCLPQSQMTQIGR